MDARDIARQTRDLFGGQPRVVRHVNDDGSLYVNILSSSDRPQAGLTSWATIDMSRFDNQLTDNAGRALRVELLAVCQSGFDDMSNVLASCAFNVASGEYSITPDIIFPNVIAINNASVQTKHALLTSPFLWDEPPAAVQEGDRVTTWLQVVPIREEEFQFARGYGVHALTDRFEQSAIDVFDINRGSAV